MEAHIRALVSSISPNDDAESRAVFLRIQTYLGSQLSKDELEVALSALLPDEGGLAAFIYRASACQHYRKLVSDIFELLMFLIDHHGHLLESYAPGIKIICMSCVLRDKAPALVKQKALETLATLLQIAPDAVYLGIPEIIQHLLRLATGQRKPLAPSVVAEIFKVLGVLSQTYLDTERYATSIFTAVLNELKHQTGDASKVDFQIIEGCFKCLSGFLEKFSKFPADDPDGSASVYNYLRKVIECDTTDRRTAQRAALDCFSLHGYQLAKFTTKDYKWWHIILSKWLSKTGDDQKVAHNAINTFYRIVAQEVVECNNQEAFSFFMGHFKTVLTGSEVRSPSIRLCIKGYGYFSAAARNHPTWISKEDVSFMFDFLLQRGEDLHQEKRSEELSDCLWVLSSMVGLQENVGIQELRALERLAVLLVEGFPRLLEPQRANAHRALISTVIHLTNANGNTLDNFIRSVVYQSVVLTVSHPIVEDVELQEDRNDVISYKNYLPLWEALLKMRNGSSDLNLASRRALSSKILDELVHSVLTVVRKLDLELKRIDDESSEEVTPICDPGSGMVAVSPRDFTVLVNTADFVEDVLANLIPDNTQMEAWIIPLISELVTLSVEKSLVSSFHKMLAATLTLAHKIGYFESVKGDAWQSCFYLVSNHIRSVASRLPQYKGNLQIESAKLLLSVPPIFVKSLIPVMGPVFQVVFRLGRSMLWLAHDGLGTLRRWTEMVEIPREDIQPLLNQVLPYLDYVLSTKDSAKVSGKNQVLIEGSNSSKPLFKRRGKRHKPKTRADTKLTTFQYDVLLFLSTLPTETVLSVIEKKESSENSCNKSLGIREQRLVYNVPFSDMKVPIYLDQLIVRAVELSLDCSDRRTRIHAIELLHALIMFMLGTEVQIDEANRTKLTALWRILFPCVLRLGCDADQTALSLFQPFGLSLTHWYSGKNFSKTDQTASLLEAILEGLIHPTDSALRDYSAKCLHEFSSWSIRQGAALENIKALFKSIDSYVKHPCPYKRLGGGLAFNSIYTVLREDKEVLDTFWIEMVCSFVKGLSFTNLEDEEEETSRQLQASIRHCGRVLTEKSNIFIKQSAKRRCPAELDKAVLKDLVRWLLFQCSSLSVECRHECMKLVCELAPKVEGCSSPLDFVAMMVKEETIGTVVNIIQRDISTEIEPNHSLKEVVRFCNHLIASVECCNWILEERLVEPGALFVCPDFKLIQVLQNFVLFVEKIADRNRPKVLNTAVCTAIIRMVDFLTIILKSSSLHRQTLTLWTPELFKLISSCVFSPSQLGFDPYSKEVREELPKRVTDFLRATKLSTFLPELDASFRGTFQQEINLCGLSLSQNRTTVTLHDREFVTGCLILYDIYKNKLDWSIIDVPAIVQVVFDSIVGRTNDAADKVYLLQLDPVAVEFGGLLLRLAVRMSAKVEDLLICLLNENVLLRFDGSGQLSQGSHFFTTYQAAIVEVLLNYGPYTIEFIVRNLKESNAQDSFAVMIALLEQSAEHKRHTSIRGKVFQVSEAILSHWTELQDWGANIEKRKSWLAALIKHVALSQTNPYGCLANHDISKWVFDEIKSEHNTLKSKIKMIGLLAFVVVREEESNEALRCVLQTLKDRHFPLKSDELRFGSEQHTNLTRAFRALLRSMEATGNLDVLRGVMRMSAADENHVCRDDILKSLTSFVERCKGLSSNHQKRILFLPFSMFKDECPIPEIRLRIVRNYLIPMLRASNHTALAGFFQETVRDLITLPTTFRASDPRMVEHQLVTRIGKTEILEIMVSKLQPSLIGGRGSPIVAAALAGQNVDTGKELIQNICKQSLAARKMVASRTDNVHIVEMFRQMHCASYNMLSALLCATKTSPEDGKFYTGMLFTEGEQQVVWRNLVDSSKNYLPVPNYDEIPERRKVQVSIRKSQQFSVEQSICYLSTQQTLDSSLSQDITRFDFSHSNILPTPISENLRQQEEGDQHGELELENDILNKHECMAMVCAVIKHMVQTGITPKPGDSEVPRSLPGWMEALRATLQNPETSPHVRLFLLKVVLNCEAEFRPYATFWLPVLLSNICQVCLTNGITYFFSDILTLMLSWRSSATPRDIGHERMLANQLLVYLVRNVNHPRRDVFRYHLDLIKNTVEFWKHALDVPCDLILEALKPKETNSSVHTETIGLQLAAIMILNELCPWNPEDKFQFLNYIITYLSSSSKPVFTAAAETVGLALNLLHKKNNGLTEEDEKFLTDLTTFLKDYVKKNKTNFFVVLNGIHKRYPAIAGRFLSIILIHFTRLQDNLKVVCLEMLKSVVQESKQSYEDFKDRDILPLLENGSAEVQVAVLQILKVVLQTLTTPETLKIVKIMAQIREHSSPSVRHLVYEVAAEVYDKFRSQGSSLLLSSKGELQEIIETSKELLLWGLVDDDGEIQKSIFKLWTTPGKLPVGAAERILSLFENFYSPSTEHRFMSCASEIMLEAVSVTPDFKTRIFPHALVECLFQDYKLITSWRAQHMSLTPMFAETLASQLSASSTQSSQSLHPFLLATQQSLAFQPTMDTDSNSSLNESLRSSSSLLFNQDSDSLGSMVSSRQYLRQGLHDDSVITDFSSGSHVSRRFRNSKQQSYGFAMGHIREREVLKKKEEEKLKRQAGEITVYREYRVGDFPDIQIQNLDIISPLQALSKRDAIVSRQLVVGLFCGIRNQLPDKKDFELSVSHFVNDLLSRSEQYDPTVIATLLELALHFELMVESAVATSAARNSQLLPLGALVLENMLRNAANAPDPVEDPIRCKRPRLERNLDESVVNDTDTSVWMELAEIYRTMGEFDIVKAIFQSKVESHPAAIAALDAAAAGEWHDAKRMYLQSLTEKRVDYFYEDYFNCLAHMSEWKGLSKSIMSMIDNKHDELWSDIWNMENLLNWLIRAEVLNFVTGKDDEGFLHVVKSWLENSTQSEYLKTHFSEDMAVLFLTKKKFPQCSTYAKQALSQFLDEWACLNPFSEKLRKKKLLESLTSAEILMYLKEVQGSTQFEEKLVEFYSCLESNMPSPQDSLVLWEPRLSYRRIITKQNEHTPSSSNLETRTLISLIETALCQGNHWMAKKYIGLARAENSASNEKFALHFELANWKERLLWTKSAENELRLKSLITIWHKLDKIPKDSLSRYPNLKWTAHSMECDLAKSFCKYVRADPHVWDAMPTKIRADLLKRVAESRNASLDEVEAFSVSALLCEVELLGLWTLRAAVAGFEKNPTAKETIDLTADAYFEIAQHCRHVIENHRVKEENDPSYLNEFKKHLVRATLSAMKFGSANARQLFPLLLSEPTLGSDLCQDFKRKSASVPEWMFLDWIPQLLATLETQAGAVEDLITRIAKAYPKAVAYPLRLSAEKQSNNNALARLLALVGTSQVEDLFVLALSCVCHPFLVLRYHLEVMIDLMPKVKAIASTHATESVWTTISAAYERLRREATTLEEVQCRRGASRSQSRTTENGVSVHGKLYDRNEPFYKKIEEFSGFIRSKNDSKLLKELQDLRKLIINAFEKERNEDDKRKSKKVLNSKLLEDFSPWLKEFHPRCADAELEIPGQYSGAGKPKPQDHVRIAGFKAEVSVMLSIRLPVRITIIGSDAREYPLLVKNGEDLRQDERLQQLLSLMNKILLRNQACNDRRLSLKTYKVIPMTSSLGVIEWVNGTMSLRDVMMHAFTNDDKAKKSGACEREYKKLFKSKDLDPRIVYGKEYLQLNPTRSQAFERVTKLMPMDCLRRSLEKLSNSPEEYFSMRQRFATSYASMCIAHWVLGIGDRHQSNCLVSMENGMCIGIDFGHAFGTATQCLPVPEMMPFRLTPHILRLTDPLVGEGSIKETMIHTLRAFRTDHSLLVATMQVFVLEPSVNWIKMAEQHAKNMEYEEVKDSDSENAQWMPYIKLQQVVDKLNGANPVLALKDDIENGHKKRSPEFLKGYLNVLKGQPQQNSRAKHKMLELSTVQQVDCLMDLATDYEVLSRTWERWDPWM